MCWLLPHFYLQLWFLPLMPDSTCNCLQYIFDWVLNNHLKCALCENQAWIPPGQSGLPAGLAVLAYGVVIHTAAQVKNIGGVLDCSCLGTSKIICKGPEGPFILGFAGHKVYVTSIQLCYCSRKAAIENSKEVGMAVFHKNFIYRSRWWGGFGLRAGVCQLCSVLPTPLCPMHRKLCWPFLQNIFWILALLITFVISCLNHWISSKHPPLPPAANSP